MPRDLTPQVDVELQKVEKYPLFFAKIQTASGDVRAWSGYGNVTFNGEVYLGVGDFGGISSIKESADLQAHPVTFFLQGVKPSNVSLALGQIRRRLRAFVWLGFLDPDTGQIVVDPYMMFKGYTDIPAIDEVIEKDNPEPRITISIKCENRLAQLNATKNMSYTTGDQKLIDPTDKGFDQVPSLQEKVISFGKFDNDEANLYVEQNGL